MWVLAPGARSSPPRCPGLFPVSPARKDASAAPSGGLRRAGVGASRILAERTGAEPARATVGRPALFALCCVPGPLYPADGVVTVALVPRVEGRGAMVGVVEPGVVLEKRELGEGEARLVVGSDRSVFAEHTSCAAGRPVLLAAVCDIRRVEVDDVVADGDVLGPPPAAVPPVPRRGTGDVAHVSGFVDGRRRQVRLAGGERERT